MDKRLKGIIATISSAMFFGLVPLFVKTINAGGGNSVSCAFYRFFLSLLPLYLIIKYKKIPMKVTSEQLAKIILITAFGYGGTAVLLFSSYNFIPSGMATTIHFTYPVFTIIGCVIFCKARIKPLKLLCVALSMTGIFLFYDGGSGANTTGMGIAFLSGITYAFYIIYLRESGLQSIPTVKLIFYMNAVASAMILAMRIVTDEFTMQLTMKAWIVAGLFAVFASLIGVFGFQIGVRYIGPENSAILSTFEPITSLVIGILLYGEVFSLRGVIGSICILISTIIVAKMKE